MCPRIIQLFSFFYNIWISMCLLAGHILVKDSTLDCGCHCDFRRSCTNKKARLTRQLPGKEWEKMAQFLVEMRARNKKDTREGQQGRTTDCRN